VRRSIFFSILGAATATFLMGGTLALASQTGFILGSTSNAPDALTAVTAKSKDGHGGLAGPMVQLTNKSTGSTASALGLTVGSGRPPLVVNSSTRVANLNADKLDGLDSSALQRKLGSCSAGAAIRSVASNGAVTCQSTHTSNILTTGASAQALPYSTLYTSHGGPILVLLSGSGWRTPAQGPGPIEIDAVIDGYSIDQAWVFTNETSSHKALITAMNFATFPAGTHQLTVQVVQGAVDGSDEFHVSLLEFPG
jgi:hypothetical protein